MNLELEGLGVLVAGASRGIGYAIARGFLAEGANVAVCGRDADALERARAGLAEEYPDRSVFALPGDMRLESDVARVVAEASECLSRLDIAVANVGSGVAPVGWRIAPEEWRAAFDENLLATALVCQAAAERLPRGGAIALIGSIAGLGRTGAPLPYAAAKAALFRYTRDLASELAGAGVRVNMVAPGNVLFSGGRWEQKLEADPEGVKSLIERVVPLQRFARPEEIADAVLFVCSARAAFVTGSCIAVDGGQQND